MKYNVTDFFLSDIPHFWNSMPRLRYYARIHSAVSGTDFGSVFNAPIIFTAAYLPVPENAKKMDCFFGYGHIFGSLHNQICGTFSDRAAL